MNSVKNGTAIHNDVLKVIQDSDYSIVNLECPVADDTDKKISKSGPNLRTTSETISYLKKCGFTHVTLANNHFYDYGDAGVSKTIEVLQKEDIRYVGGGRNREEIHEPLYLNTDDGRIAILNYCEHEFSAHEPMGSNPMDPITVYYDIIAAKKSCDYVIIICHGGHEGYQLPSPRMKKLYRYFIDLGADIVCNHHQHCFSGWEAYNGGMIHYGLGNFFFDDFRPLRQRDSSWNYGYMFHVQIDNHRLMCNLIPYSQCLSTKECKLLIGDDYTSFTNEINSLSHVIASPELLQKSFDSFCKRMKKNMITDISAYSNRYLKALCRRGLLPTLINRQKALEVYNLIRCESHRDVAVNILTDI